MKSSDIFEIVTFLDNWGVVNVLCKGWTGWRRQSWRRPRQSRRFPFKLISSIYQLFPGTYDLVEQPSHQNWSQGWTSNPVYPNNILEVNNSNSGQNLGRPLEDCIETRFILTLTAMIRNVNHLVLCSKFLEEKPMLCICWHASRRFEAIYCSTYQHKAVQKTNLSSVPRRFDWTISTVHLCCTIFQQVNNISSI